MISAQTQTDTSLTPQPARTALSGPSNRPETDSLPGPPNDSPTHSLVRDSLGQPGADSLASIPFGADSLLSADSLFMAGTAVPDSLAAEPAPLYRPATAKEVFGSYSIAAAPAPAFHSEPVRPLTGNPVFEGLVLLLAAAYAMLLYRHIGDIRLLLYRVSHDRASSERLMEDPGGNTLTRFLKISGIIGLLFIGIAAARYARVVALFAQILRKCTEAARQRHIEARHVHRHRAPARHDRRTRGYALRRGRIGAVEAHALRREAVQIRRHDVAVAVAAHRKCALVVAQHQQDVRLFGLRRRASAQYSAAQQHAGFQLAFHFSVGLAVSRVSRNPVRKITVVPNTMVR